MSGSVSGEPPKEYKIEIFNSKSRSRKHVDISKLNKEQQDSIKGHFKDIENEARKWTQDKGNSDFKVTPLKISKTSSNGSFSFGPSEKIKEHLEAIEDELEKNSLLTNDDSLELSIPRKNIEEPPTKLATPAAAEFPSTPLTHEAVLNMLKIPDDPMSKSVFTSIDSSTTGSTQETKVQAEPKTPRFFQSILNYLKKITAFSQGLFTPPPKYPHSPLNQEIDRTQKAIFATRDEQRTNRLEAIAITRRIQDIKELLKNNLNASEISDHHLEIANLTFRKDWLTKQSVNLKKTLTDTEEQLKTLLSIRQTINEDEFSADSNTNTWKDKEKEYISHVNTIKSKREEILTKVLSLPAAIDQKSSDSVTLLKNSLNTMLKQEQALHNRLNWLESIAKDPQFIQLAKEQGISLLDFNTLFGQFSPLKETNENLLLKLNDVYDLLNQNEIEQAVNKYFDVMNQELPLYIETFKKSALILKFSQDINDLLRKKDSNLQDLFRTYGTKEFLEDTSLILTNLAQYPFKFEAVSRNLQSILGNTEETSTFTNREGLKKASDTHLTTVQNHLKSINNFLIDYEGMTDTTAIKFIVDLGSEKKDKKWAECMKGRQLNFFQFERLNSLYIQSAQAMEQLIKVNFALELNPSDEILKAEAKKLSLKTLKSVQNFRKEYQRMGGDDFVVRVEAALDDYLLTGGSSDTFEKAIQNARPGIDFLRQRIFYFDKFFEERAQDLGIKIK